MSKRSPPSRRHDPLSALLYLLTGLAVFLAFLPIWGVISEYRVLIVVLAVIVFATMQSRAWRRQLAERRERRRRWGLSGYRRNQGRT